MTVLARQPALVTVGIDLGGTGTRFVALDAQGVVLANVSVPTLHTGDPNEHMAFFRQHIEAVIEHHRLVAIGIGASGPVDAGGIIRNPDTLPALSGLDLPALLGTHFGVPCLIDNDAVTAALGEAHYGAARAHAAMLMVTLGTGVGVCMLRDGVPDRGGDGQHPEAGHMSVSGPAAPCYCGRAVCWEQVASRTALGRAAITFAPNAPSERHALHHLASRAEQGDDSAQALFTAYGQRLGDGLANLLTALRPGCVVLGGGGAVYLEQYRSALLCTLASVRDCYPAFALYASALGDEGGAIGAAAMAWTSFEGGAE
jgi:glucokinase